MAARKKGRRKKASGTRKKGRARKKRGGAKRKSAKRGGKKGHIPLDVLEKRARKLNRIVTSRGGSV